MPGTTLERVIGVIERKLRTDNPMYITPTSRFREDLGLNFAIRRGGLAYVDVTLGLEAEFQLQIPDEVVVGWETVQDIVDYIDPILAQEGEHT